MVENRTYSYFKEHIGNLVSKLFGRGSDIPWSAFPTLLISYPIKRAFINQFGIDKDVNPIVTVKEDQDMAVVTLLDGNTLYWPKEYALETISTLYKELLPNNPHNYLDLYTPNPNDVVFDIGACEGLFSLKIRHGVSQLHLFEPVKRACEGLYKTFEKEIKTGKVFIHEKILMDTNKEGVLKASTHSINITEFISDPSSTSSVMIATTLDELVEAHKISSVDLIKMDIEGAELQALMGGAQTLIKFKPDVLVCVYHRRKDLREITHFLAPMGYRFKTNGVLLMASAR